MEFQAISLAHKPMVTKYMAHWGAGSCQHSFASMYCLQGKYADAVCERDGWLFTCRTGRCTADYRVYLAPMGEGDIGAAIELLRADARAHNAYIQLETVTRSMGDAITAACPGEFKVEERRDWAEYLYTTNKLANLPGSEMASKRHDVSTFWRHYDNRVSIRPMTEKTIDETLEFQARWMEANCEEEDLLQLTREDQAIQTALCHFNELGMDGILLDVDGKLCGYACGSPLSAQVYDVMYEKGDREIEDIYRILNQEFVRRCCGKFQYINREEDLGVEGLRRSKLSYKPDLLLEKLVLSEVRRA